MKTNNNSKKSAYILRKIVLELKKKKYVSAIYLFGSHAKGTALPFSDTDLCIFTHTKITEQQKADLVSYSSDTIDIVLFCDMPIVMRYAVIKDGKPLFIRDVDFINESTSLAITEYLDFRHVLERFSEEYFGDRIWIDKK